MGMTISERIEELIGVHGSMRAVARVLRIDPAYLLRLKSGEKNNPSNSTIHKLGLRKRVIYFRRAPQTPDARSMSQLRIEAK